MNGIKADPRTYRVGRIRFDSLMARFANELAHTWKPEHRRLAEGHGLRYPRDLSDTRRALLKRWSHKLVVPSDRVTSSCAKFSAPYFHVPRRAANGRRCLRNLAPKCARHYYFMHSTGSARTPHSTTNTTPQRASRPHAKRRAR